MSYIGRGIDQIDNISTLDNLSFNGSLQTFNLTQNSVAFVPVSADALQIQIDGVIQSGNYTCSGSQVTFDFTPSGSSVCNGIRHFGVGIITSVSDGAVTNTKLGADSVNGSKIADDSISDEHLDITAITGQTAITSLADTDKFLVSDASDSGNLKYVEKQYLPSGGLVKISSQTISSTVSTIDFTSVFSSTYKNYMIVFSNIQISSTGETRFQFKVGSTVQNSDSSGNDYNWVNQGRHINNGDANGQQAGTTSFRIHGDNNSWQDEDVSFTMMIFNPLIARKKRVIAHGNYTNASQYLALFSMSGLHSSTATNFDGFRFSRSAGSFYANGEVTLYGLVS